MARYQWIKEWKGKEQHIFFFCFIILNTNGHFSLPHQPLSFLLPSSSSSSHSLPMIWIHYKIFRLKLFKTNLKLIENSTKDIFWKALNEDSICVTKFNIFFISNHFWIKWFFLINLQSIIVWWCNKLNWVSRNHQYNERNDKKKFFFMPKKIQLLFSLNPKTYNNSNSSFSTFICRNLFFSL